MDLVHFERLSFHSTILSRFRLHHACSITRGWSSNSDTIGASEFWSVAIAQLVERIAAAARPVFVPLSCAFEGYQGSYFADAKSSRLLH